MKTLLPIIALLFPIMAISQIKPVNFNDCRIDEMFVQAEKVPIWSCDSISLIDYMNKFIDDKNLEQIVDGKIFLGIIIYPDGMTCCKSFANLTKIELDANKFKEVIDRMPKWAPAIQNGKKITFMKNQVFTIRKGKFTLN